MIDDKCIINLENCSKFTLNKEEKDYILNSINKIIKKSDKLSKLPKIDETIFNNIENETI